MKQDKFSNRYIIKVGSSILIAVLNMVIQMLIPRAFSTDEYGYFTYNMNVFTSLVVLANLSASNAMVAKFSKRNDEIGILKFYLKFYCLVALLLNVGLMILFPLERMQQVFGGQTLWVVLLALDAYIITKLQTDVISMYDASAISRFPAIMQIVIKILMSVLVVAGFALGALRLSVFYIFLIVVTGGVAAILLIALFRDNKKRYPEQINMGWKSYAAEYFEFCRPLIIATGIAQLMTILMNYVLLRYSGATEQAMFGAAWQLNALVGYVFSPYAELMKREYGVVVHDAQKLKERFHQSIQLMSWLTSYFAVFIGIFAVWVLPIVYGSNYDMAMVVTLIIMYYTVFQAMGQMTGSFLIATEDTRIQAVFTIVGQIVTLLGVFLYQIPNFIWPDGLGASGIALNYLTVNIINVTIMVTYIAKKLKLPGIWENLVYWQAIVITTVFALILRIGVGILLPQNGVKYALVKVFIGGFVYTLAVAGVIYARPAFIGITREAIHNKVRALKQKLSGK
jgi:O-antigen/teichoic acid export membrane protein